MLRAVLVCCLLGFPAFADDNVLVRVTDFWRVIAAFPNSPEPKPNWTEPAYDDSSWPLLQASFSSIYGGLPGSPEATILSISNNSTYCFRKTFTIADPTFIRVLSLRIDYEH